MSDDLNHHLTKALRTVREWLPNRSVEAANCDAALRRIDQMVDGSKFVNKGTKAAIIRLVGAAIRRMKDSDGEVCFLLDELEEIEVDLGNVGVISA